VSARAMAAVRTSMPWSKWFQAAKKTSPFLAPIAGFPIKFSIVSARSYDAMAQIAHTRGNSSYICGPRLLHRCPNRGEARRRDRCQS
jgi:hypothetical protein